MGPVRVFLDANILFSAALGGEAFALLWELAAAGKVILVTSPYCRLEAEANLRRKRPQALPAYRERIAGVTEVPNVGDALKEHLYLPEKDAPVYAAAVSAGAAVLLTGDVKHFGALMERDDLAVRVQTIRDFLLQDAPGRQS